MILRVVNLFYELSAKLNDRHEANITRRELSQLSEHQLRDIGLTRAYVNSL